MCQPVDNNTDKKANNLAFQDGYSRSLEAKTYHIKKSQHPLPPSLPSLILLLLIYYFPPLLSFLRAGDKEGK